MMTSPRRSGFLIYPVREVSDLPCGLSHGFSGLKTVMQITVIHVTKRGYRLCDPVLNYVDDQWVVAGLPLTVVDSFFRVQQA